MRLLALLATAAAQREFQTGKCEALSAGIATPAKAIEEACKSDLSLTSGQCEFFTEAWGLAITHPGFSAKDFCQSVGGAFRCSLLMDTVLTSPAVTDLAFAACVREQGAGAVEYCQQFQNSIQVADHSTDLDTLRACYLLEEEAKTVAAPIVAPANTTGITAGGTGNATPPEPVLTNASAAKPFGETVDKGSVPVKPGDPSRITVEPLHGVRRNGSAYEDHHILQGDGPLSSAGKGTPAEKDLPAFTREQLAVGAATEAGKLAGGTAGSEAGKAAGEDAGHAAGKEVGLDIAANKTVPREAIESAAYKAGFDAGKEAGADVVTKEVTSSLVRVASTTVKRVADAVQKAAAQHTVLAKPAEVPAKPAATAVAKPTAKHAKAVSQKVPAKDADKKNLKAVQPVKTEAKTAAKQSKEKEPKEKDDEEAKKIAPYGGFLTKFYSVST
jgi:hypothetical protein